MKKYKYLTIALALTCSFTACENGGWEFPDYEYSTVYFGSQTPIRTLCMGEDVNPTELDNNHQCEIVATVAGVYSNNQDVKISISVDESLCEGLTFDGEKPVLPMPSNYYTIGNEITIPKGRVIGGTLVQFTDAYFNDPKTTELTYVIPVRMNSIIAGADSILSGTPMENVSSPRWSHNSDWSVQPKNYVLYAVKYKNKYHSAFLRRGKDVYSGAKTGTVVRHAAYVEQDEVHENSEFVTRGLQQLQWNYKVADQEGKNINTQLLLTFNESDGTCTITSEAENVTATGSGKFVPKGDKNSWGNKDRDVLYLDYTLEYDGIKCVTQDTLVVRDRGMKAEWFTPVED